MFAQLGIPTYGIRACAKVRDDREELTHTVHEIFIINMVMSLLAYIALLSALAFIPRLQDEKLLYIIVSCTIFFNAIGMEWLYKSLEQYTYITIRSLIFKVVTLVAMFLLIHEQKDYIIYGAISILAASGSNIFNFINIHRYVDIKPVGNYKFKRHFKPILVFFAMSCATTIYTNLDTVMLGFMASAEDVGYYYAAIKIKIILVSIVTSLGTVMLPRASYYVERGMEKEFQRISKKAFNFVILVAMPMMLYFILFANEGIKFLAGDAYVGSVLPMQLIMPTLLFIGLSNIIGIQILIPLGKEKIVLYSVIAGAFTDMVLNAILIPEIASSGAAVGNLVAEFVVLLVQYKAVNNEEKPSLGQVRYFNIIIAMILGTIASIWIKNFMLNSLLTLLISACLFFGVYGCFLLIVREELVVEIFDQVIGNRIKKIKSKKVSASKDAV
jgi:O-antigen/teichoic acid export membrane protein